MTIDFPSSPTVDQEYTFEGRTWVYNGIGWQIKKSDVVLGTAAFKDVGTSSGNVPQLDSNGHLVNSVMGASSIGANGYYTEPGGLIWQWGLVPGTITDPVTVNFPTAFPNSCLSAVGTIEGVSATNTLESVAIFNTSTSSFLARKRYAISGGGAVAGESFRWIAVGN